MTEERKLVTVLFADIVGSTAIGTSHDPEVVRRTLSRAFSEVRQVLELHGGTVEKFIGDAVMAVFGIPQAHDDDADRAVRAAFGLRERITGLNADGRFALELRIGINSGEVVTGDAGETLVTGEAVNAGARLQAAAAPNEILVGGLTHRLTDRAVRYGPSREIEAKGLGRLPAWPVAALGSSLPAQHRGIAGLRAPLIGRDDELRLLVDAHRKLAAEERAALVTIFGAAGVGKSRLVEEFIETVGADRVRRGRCLPYGEGITFWPVVEILRADAGITALDSHGDATRKLRTAVLEAFSGVSEDAEAVARRLSVLAGTITREEALPDVSGDSVQQELRWGLRRYLERRASAAPLALVFDDIHWAEPALLDLVEHLAEWSRAPLFLLCMARPDLRELRAGWGGGLMNASAIRLEPLTADESVRLIRDLLNVDALPDELRDQVITRAEGNPLYVEEFLKMLLDAGHIAKRDGRYVATESIGSLVVPASLQSLIAARLDRSPAALKHLLQRAAVIGKVFWPEAVMAQGPLGGSIDALLMDAARRDLVSELDERGLGGGRAWTFRHILIRDVAYESIPKAERSRAHDAFGRWLEATAGERIGEYADIVAYHAEQAFQLARELGEPDLGELGGRAYRHLTAGGLTAQRRGDWRAALAFYRRALVAADVIQPPAAEHLETRAFVARARMAIEDSLEMLEEISTLVTELRAVPPTAVLVEFLQILSVAQSDKDFGAATALDDEAVATARAIGDPEVVASALLQSSWVPWVRGDLVTQRRILLAARDHMERTGAQQEFSQALVWLGVNAVMGGAFVEAAADMERGAQRAVQSGSSWQRAVALRSRVWNALHHGDLERAEAVAREALEAAVDTGERSVIGVNQWFLADALCYAERHDEEREVYERAIELLSGAPSQGLRAEARTRLANVLVKLGRVEDARIQAEAARAEVASGDTLTIATAAAALGAVRAAEGHPAEAERLYHEALDTIGRTGYVAPRMGIQRDYAIFLMRSGRPAEARPLLEELRAFYDTPATPYEVERTDVLLRECAAVMT